MTDSLHLKLRQACLTAHGSIEATYPFNSLTKHDISASEMAFILSTMYQVHASLSQYLAANLKTHHLSKFVHPACRIKELQSDLAGLAIKPADSLLSIALPKSIASSIGMLYVLMGSTLGGAFIAKSLAKCSDAKVRAAVHFFAGDADNRGKRWATFTRALDAFNYSVDEENLAIAGALYTFDLIQQQFIATKEAT